MPIAATAPRGARLRLRGTAGIVGVLALLTACGSSTTPEPAETVTLASTVQADKAPAPTPTVPTTWPLTGVPVDAVAQRPALAVKIENTAVARPQTGLDQADVVWETIVEFEVSRFVAVFHSQVPDEVGPIRSVRPMDPLILQPLHGILAFSGGQAGILAEVEASGVQMMSHDAGAPGMFRVSTRSAPHNVYGTPQTWWDAVDAEHAAVPAEQFAFARTAEKATAVAAGTPATTLAFRLSAASSPSWVWDTASGTWLRSEGSTPAMAASGARLSAVNVVSITADHPNSGFGAQGGAPVPTYSLVGSGEGVLASGGKTVPVRWEKTAEDAPMVLHTLDGASATLAPGNTWVELVPAATGSLTVS
ncbi:DUF3048 domain-containing protein [Cellulomonas soli]|uniref:DUF3048 domain-containing protein n=1 Tax=Cellulomonas soli TaxID=931535 RepID=UPI003F878258